MNRQEFLSKLESAMEGEVSPRVIQSNLQYYQNYILDEMRKGRDEQEVLEELGDPRLIARTIFDSQEAAEGVYGTENYAYDETAAESHRYAYDGTAEDARYAYDAGNRYTYDPEGAENEGDGLEGNGISSFWAKIRPTLIIAAVIIVLLAVLSALFGLALTVLTSPVFWIILAAWGLWNTFGR